MNRIHRIVFNRSTGHWQAVSETARGHGRGGSTRKAVLQRLGLAAAGVALALPAWAGAGGQGGTPTPQGYVVYGGAGGSDGQGGQGGFNDDTLNTQGGAGGHAGPGGPTAGAAASGAGVGPSGAGGAAGTSGAPDGQAGGSETGGGGFGGGGGGGFHGAAEPTFNAGSLAGGQGGAGGDGYWAAGGGGAGGLGAVLDGAGTSFTNSGSVAGGAGGAGGVAYSQGGGGGGGGSGLSVNTTGTVTNSGAVLGGAGGQGGSAGIGGVSSFYGPSGSGGGGGGNGVTLTSGTLRNEAGGTIAGGAGGHGGANAEGTGPMGTQPGPAGVPGNGGSGGDGIHAASTGQSLFNAGTVQGGDGGTGGASVVSGVPDGQAGAGGAGARITGDGNTLVNASLIGGGLSGDGATRAEAVRITGNANTLELQAGYGFNGAVLADGAGNALALGGTTDASFDVTQVGPLGGGAALQGFTQFIKTGASTWTLANTTGELTPWTVRGGVLSIGADSALGGLAGGLTLDGGTLQTTADIATARAITLGAAGGGLAPVAGSTLTLTGAIAGSGPLTKDGAGTLTLAGANAYTGTTTVAAGTLRAGAAGAFSTASAHTVAAGATMDLAGFSQTIAAMDLAGTVSLPGSAPGTTLTVTGPWVGNGGTLRLGTALGDSASATDRLVLSGSGAVASGHTSVQITNLGGLGALTTGDGIEVVRATGGATTTAQTSKDAFSLAGGHVDAGAYEYRLHAADASGAGESWYLRSTATGGGGVSVPTYRAEVPLLAALPEQLREAGLAMLGNLHQRVGDDGVGGASAGPRQAWGRLISIDRHIQQGGTVSPTSEGRLSGFQAGTDLWADPNWRVGLYVGQLEGDMDVTGFARGLWNHAAGRNDLRTQYLGGYATWKNRDGFYVDGVLQAGRLRYDVQPALGWSTSGKGRSVLASVELGQAFQVAPGWQVEPQLQLVHQDLELDDLGLVGAAVRQGADSGWLLRAGVRVKGEIATGAGALQPYARLNMYRRSSGTDVTRYATAAAVTEIATRTGGTSWELAGGATWQLTPALSVYGELGRLWAGGGGNRTKSGLNGSLGVKVSW